MKVGTLNLSPGSTGTTTMSVPRGAELVGALLMGGVVQVNYTYEGDAGQAEPVDFMIVQNGQEYDGKFVYLSELVDTNKRVTHLVYRSSDLTGGNNPQVNPLQAAALPKGA